MRRIFRVHAGNLRDTRRMHEGARCVDASVRHRPHRLVLSAPPLDTVRLPVEPLVGAPPFDLSAHVGHHDCRDGNRVLRGDEAPPPLGMDAGQPHFAHVHGVCPGLGWLRGGKHIRKKVE